MRHNSVCLTHEVASRAGFRCAGVEPYECQIVRVYGRVPRKGDRRAWDALRRKHQASERQNYEWMWRMRPYKGTQPVEGP